MKFTIPLQAQINTQDDYSITNLDTNEPGILRKKNTLTYKNLLSNITTSGGDSVYTTTGKKISKLNNNTLQDELGRKFHVDNSMVLDKSADITNLWNGTLTSAIAIGDYIYSIWQSERDYTIVKSNFKNEIIKSTTVDVSGDLLYFNVKLANYTRIASKYDNTIIFALQKVYTDSTTDLFIYKLEDDLPVQLATANYSFLTGKALYVLRYGTIHTAVGTDDIDIRKRFTFTDDLSILYKYWGCLGSNGLLTGEPVYCSVDHTDGKTSALTITQPALSFLDNGRGYCPTYADSYSDSDTAWLSANSSITGGMSDNGARTWGGVTHNRTVNKSWIAGFDLEKNIPLVISASLHSNNNFPAPGESNGFSLIPLEDIYFRVPGVGETKNSIGFELVDFSEGLGNYTWSNGTTALITNGCNPFPYRYAIHNRADARNNYWAYGPGWARSYIREAIIGQWGSNVRVLYERYPTALISYGLNSANLKTNCVRVEQLSPTTFDTSTSYSSPTVNGKWVRNSTNGNQYFRLHTLTTSYKVWCDFIGADNLGPNVLLGSLPFQVDIEPGLNIKDQYFALNYVSTSMEGTLLTSGSMQLNSNSYLFCENANRASLFSNGMVLQGTRNGDVTFEKISDYIFKTNTIKGNNLFIEQQGNLYGQRAFIAYNGEEVIDLSEQTTFTPPIDDTNSDGNDTYYTASGCNVQMNDPSNRGVSYLLPAAQIQLIIKGEESKNFSFQLMSNRKEITKPLLLGSFTYKDEPVDHYYTETNTSTDIKYSNSKKLQSSSPNDLFGIATYDSDKANQSWWISSSIQIYPLGLGSIITGQNFLASTVDLTDNYTVRLYRQNNSTYPVYNPNTEVYKGSTIFTIYGNNYSFDGQSVYSLGAGDDTAQNQFTAYVLGMKFLANSANEAYFYSPFEKKIYIFTGSVSLNQDISLAREGNIVDSLYSSCEQALYLLLEKNGVYSVLCRTENDMCVFENVGEGWHLESTDSGMVLSKGFGYKLFRLHGEDGFEPLEIQTELLGRSNNFFKIKTITITFYNDNNPVNGSFYYETVGDVENISKEEKFTITSRDWKNSTLYKVMFTINSGIAKALSFGIKTNTRASISDITFELENVSENTNAPKHR